jgi:hypothetical protein
MIDITENFDNSQGAFVNYDTFDDAQKFGFLPNQRHVDIRAFNPGSSEVVQDMLYLDGLNMTTMNTETMGDLADVTAVISETWTLGTIGPLTGNNWNGISYAFPVGLTALDSIIRDFDGNVVPIDLETDFQDTDDISVALPDFAKTKLDLDNTFIVFTSDPDGDFFNPPVAPIAFSESTVDLVHGDSELRFPRSLIAGIDLSSITGVRFLLNATATGTFKCLAVRLLASTWIYSDLDIDTVNQRLSRTVTLDGDVSPSVAGIAVPYPVLIRSDDEFGPAPINSSISATFNTGSKAQEGNFSIYLREKSIDYTTMLDLDGTEVDDLDGHVQPNFSPAKYIIRTQQDFDGEPDGAEGLDQNDLDGVTQFILERKPDPLNASFIQVTVSWDDTTSTVGVQNSESTTPYQFAASLSANQDYAIIINLDDETLQISIYELAMNVLGTKVFESGLINDSVLVRNAGRIGWAASFTDGDAFLDSIRPRHLEFAELRSHPYIFQQKIRGVRLQTGSTESSNLFRGIDTGPFGGYFQAYPARGPEAFQMRNINALPYQGIRTNFMDLDDFNETVVEFDLFVTSDLLAHGTIQAFLWDGVNPTDLDLGPITGNNWNHVYIDLSYIDNRLSGSYAVVLAQTNVSNNLWAIDKFRVMRNNIHWDARDYRFDDSWGIESDLWIDFKETVNGPNDGVVLRERTNAAQIRGKALRQNAQIGELRVIPQYAQLGRIIFNEDYPPAKYLDDDNFPTSAFTHSVSGHTATLNSTAVPTQPLQYIVQTAWTFGDGREDFGKHVTHTYTNAGTYTVTQSVTDNWGLRSSSSANVTIS